MSPLAIDDFHECFDHIVRTIVYRSEFYALDIREVGRVVIKEREGEVASTFRTVDNLRALQTYRARPGEMEEIR